MKKIIPLFSFFAFIFHTAIAQPGEQGLTKFGFTAGAGFSHMDFSKGVPPLPIKTSWNAGVRVGFLLQVHLTGNLFLQPEYAFVQMGGKIKDSATSYQLNYFSMHCY